MMQGPLHGVRVLELGQFLSAPRCGRILAEQGAEVIKIEPLMGEPMRLLMTLSGAEKSLSVVNAGKKGLALDLKHPRARDVFLALVDGADVVVENLGPGALDRLGLSFAALRARNPRLVCCSISGFGREGPLKDRLAFDIIAQASSGIMHGMGLPDTPPPILFGDLVSGAYAAMAVGFALVGRARTGEGAIIDLSMQDVMYAQHFHAQTTRALGDDHAQVRAILGRDLADILSSPTDPLPFWAVYRARDGRVALVALTDGHWGRLMRVIGRPELEHDARFASFPARVRNARDGREIVEAWTRGRTARELLDALVEGGIPCALVADTAQVNADPNLAARGMLDVVDDPRLGAIPVPGPAVVVGARSGRDPTGPAPALGEHTDAVLAAAGFTPADVEGLRAEGVVA